MMLWHRRTDKSDAEGYSNAVIVESSLVRATLNMYEGMAAL